MTDFIAEIDFLRKVAFEKRFVKLLLTCNGRDELMTKASNYLQTASNFEIAAFVVVDGCMNGLKEIHILYPNSFTKLSSVQNLTKLLSPGCVNDKKFKELTRGVALRAEFQMDVANQSSKSVNSVVMRPIVRARPVEINPSNVALLQSKSKRWTLGPAGDQVKEVPIYQKPINSTEDIGGSSTDSTSHKVKLGAPAAFAIAMWTIKLSEINSKTLRQTLVDTKIGEDLREMCNWTLNSKNLDRIRRLRDEYLGLFRYHLCSEEMVPFINALNEWIIEGRRLVASGQSLETKDEILFGNIGLPKEFKDFEFDIHIQASGPISSHVGFSCM